MHSVNMLLQMYGTNVHDVCTVKKHTTCTCTFMCTCNVWYMHISVLIITHSMLLCRMCLLSDYTEVQAISSVLLPQQPPVVQVHGGTVRKTWPTVVVM